MKKNDLENLRKNNNIIEIEPLMFSDFLKKDSLMTENYWLNISEDIDNYIIEVKKAMFDAIQKKVNGQASVETLMFTPDSKFVVKQIIGNQELYYTSQCYNLLPPLADVNTRRAAIAGIIVTQVTLTILKHLAVGLISSIGSYAGTSILNSIFGGKGYSIDELRDELTSNTIATSAGVIEGILNFFDIEYPKHVEENTDKRMLLASLEKRIDELRPALFILEQERFRREGIEIYITGANLMLYLWVEMSILEGAIKNTKPEETKYRKIYTDYLARFVLHVSNQANNEATFNIITSWLLSINPKRYVVKLIPTGSKKLVFDVEEASKKAGKPLICFPSHSSRAGKNQQFLFVPVFNKSDDPEDIRDCFYIISYLSGMALDVPKSSKDDKLQLVQWPLYGSSNQIFRVEKQNDGTCKIYSKCSGKIIVGDTANYKKVMQVSKEGSYYNRFELEEFIEPN